MSTDRNRTRHAGGAGHGGPAGDDGEEPSRLLPRLAIELIIGLTFAALLVIVALTSSNAIRFVYGGY